MSSATGMVARSEKIGPVHLGRTAVVYVRQSTLTQVREHAESLARQYELSERAIALGWDAHQVQVVDEDLGRSGAEATARSGFKDLVAEVGLGHVGVILGIEVSRLARNNADWYRLLDLCAVTNTLIADSDGVYHPGEFNDRLVLGLKGTMSEAELHLIRSRMTAGLRHKAERGQLRQGLPVGFDYDHDGTVVFTADEAVVEAIATVYRRFEQLGSARQVLLSLREDGLLLPRRPGRTGRIAWARATYPAVHDLLTNPCYAGAFVFGRTRADKRVDAAGRLVTTTVTVPREQWPVLIPQHHRGYISWAQYEANTARLRANWRPPRGSGGGVAREGSALLQGLLRCRAVWPDHANRVLRPHRQQSPVRVRPSPTAVRRPQRLSKHRRRTAAGTGAGGAVHRAGASLAGRDCPSLAGRRAGLCRRAEGVHPGGGAGWV